MEVPGWTEKSIRSTCFGGRGDADNEAGVEESPLRFTLSKTSEILISGNLAFSCGILTKISYKTENVSKPMLNELKLLKLLLQNPCRKGCTFRSGDVLANEMYAYS